MNLKIPSSNDLHPQNQTEERVWILKTEKGLECCFSVFCFKNPHPFPKPPSFKSTPFPSNKFRLFDDIYKFEIKIKNKKKEGKGKFQVYKKASSSLRFLIKSPPITFRYHTQLRLHVHTSDDISGSILSKKLAFLKPST